MSDRQGTTATVEIHKPLTYSEAGRLLGCCSRTIGRLVRQGHLRAIRLPGGRPKIHPQDLAELVERARAESQAEPTD